MTVAPHPTSVPPRSPAYPWHMPDDWWMKNKRYFSYMVRELTAVFAALWVLVFLIHIPMMAAGPQDMATHVAWVNFVHNPYWTIFSVICFFLVGYHAITWFILMGTVMWMRFGASP